MNERYQIPKVSWYIPFGPINGVDLIKVSAINRYRVVNTHSTYSHGQLLVRLESMFENSKPVTSYKVPPQPNCTCYLRGTTPGHEDRPGTLFVVRDGAIIAVKTVNRGEWTVIEQCSPIS